MQAGRGRSEVRRGLRDISADHSGLWSLSSHKALYVGSALLGASPSARLSTGMQAAK